MTNSVRLFTLKLTLPLTLTNQLLPIMYVNNMNVVLNVKYKENYATGCIIASFTNYYICYMDLIVVYVLLNCWVSYGVGWGLLGLSIC